MEKETFILEQFRALRSEMDATKSRLFKLSGVALALVPTAQYISYTNRSLHLLILLLPLLVIALAFLYMSESHSAMRIGRYIRQNIEPQIEDVLGWENWLETKSEYDTRTVDKYSMYCFYILFVVYFLGAAALACAKAYELWGGTGFSAALGSYIAIGGWFGIFWIRNIRQCTTTRVEHER